MPSVRRTSAAAGWEGASEEAAQVPLGLGTGGGASEENRAEVQVDLGQLVVEGDGPFPGDDGVGRAPPLHPDVTEVQGRDDVRRVEGEGPLEGAGRLVDLPRLGERLAERLPGEGAVRVQSDEAPEPGGRVGEAPGGEERAPLLQDLQVDEKAPVVGRLEPVGGGVAGEVPEGAQGLRLGR